MASGESDWWGHLVRREAYTILVGIEDTRCVSLTLYT